MGIHQSIKPEMQLKRSTLKRTTSFNVHDDHFFVTDIDGIDTNAIVFKKKNRKNPRRFLVLIMPGNPGVCEFYYEFARLLFEHSSQRDDIVVVSHAGHCGRDIENNATFSLQDQIKHKLVVLDQLSDSESNLCREFDIEPASDDSPFILLGHSIGAYINMKLYLAKPQLPIKTIVNLFPTFRNLYDGLVPAVRLAVQPGMRQIFACILHYAPTWMSRMLLKLSNELSDEAKYATADKLSYDFVNNILFMAYCETLEVTQVENDLNQLFSNANQKNSSSFPQLIFLYGKTDNYTPLSFVDDLKKEHPHLKKYIHLADDGVKHAFVLQNSKQVADQLQSIVPDFKL